MLTAHFLLVHCNNEKLSLDRVSSAEIVPGWFKSLKNGGTNSIVFGLRGACRFCFWFSFVLCIPADPFSLSCQRNCICVARPVWCGVVWSMELMTAASLESSGTLPSDIFSRNWH